MESYNKIELRGNVGSIRISENGNGRFAAISVATNYMFKTRDGEASVETCWLTVIVWEGKLVKNLDAVQKGSRVFVSGRIRQNRYKGNDGTEKFSYEIIPQTFTLEATENGGQQQS